MKDPIISASILAADFANLAQDTNAVLNAGINAIHFDVMDHHFVPNLSFGAVVCKALRQAGTTAPIDVHLMVEDPDYYVEPFAKAGASLLTFHPETSTDVATLMKRIRDAGMQTGLAFNPGLPVKVDDAILADLDLLLLMSVNPGFAGQTFLDGGIEKLHDTRKLLDRAGKKTRLGIDGGIKIENIGKAAKAGADFFVVGSGLFHTHDYKKRVMELRRAIADGF